MWVRIEPQDEDSSLTIGPQGCVLDPLWMLTRQWQLGEFQGTDTGTAVDVAVALTTTPLTGFSPGTGGQDVQPVAPALPLEVQVERESVDLGLRGSIQLGLRFEAMLMGQAESAATLPGLLTAFRAAYPISTAVPANLVSDPRTSGVLAALDISPVTDGVALANALLAANAAPPAGGALQPPSGLPAAALSGGAMLPPVQSALAAFLAYRRALFDEPPGLPPPGAKTWNPAPSWDPTRLRYAFDVDSAAPGNDVPFTAPEFPGGHLDWYDLDVGSTPPQNAPSGSATVSYYRFLPHPLEFPGMPQSRFWEFEDARTDYGQVDAEPVDLVKVLLAEASLLYGNDWLGAPIPLPRGVRSTINAVVVTDDFGQRLLVPPTTTQVPVPSEAPPWSMFRPDALPAGTDTLVTPPALSPTVDGPPLEHVEFMLDANAMIAWGAETLLPGPLDNGVDTVSAYLQSRTAPVLAPEIPASGAGSSAGKLVPASKLAPSANVKLSFVRVNATPSVTSGDAPLTVSFTAGVSGSDPGPWTYAWNFGDGAISSQQNPSHEYANPGTYSATVTVTDPSGRSWTSTPLMISVAVAPMIQYQLANNFPNTWVPLLYLMSQPNAKPPGAFFQRASVPSLSLQLGGILSAIFPPGTSAPFVLQDRAIPEMGTAVDRYFRFARSADGGTHLWIGRRVGVGRGTGHSGLAFDQIVLEPSETR